MLCWYVAIWADLELVGRVHEEIHRPAERGNDERAELFRHQIGRQLYADHGLVAELQGVPVVLSECSQVSSDALCAEALADEPPILAHPNS